MIARLPDRLEPQQFYEIVRELGGQPLEIGKRAIHISYNSRTGKSESVEGEIIGGRLGFAHYLGDPRVVEYRLMLDDGSCLDAFARTLRAA